MLRVLLISHEPEAAPGLIGELLALDGIKMHQHIVLADPDAPNVDFPDPSAYDAVIAFGSFANAYEASARAWVEPEIMYIEQLLADDVPYLGVCFGGQLLAEALGGHVEPAPPGEAEIGLIFLDPGEQGLPIPAGPWFTWHEDRMVIPDSVELLASTPSAVQLFRSGRAVGTQFHPEADLGLVSGWAAIGPDHIPSHTSAAEVLGNVSDANAELRKNCNNLVEWFIRDIAGLEFAELKVSNDSAPLAGIVVVSVEQAISAPFATRQLADLGANVIKIERPEGDFARHYDSLVNGNSAFFVWANVGKQSVAIDMRNPDDERLLKSLIAGADVFVHNMSPAAAIGRGIDADTLRAQYSNLIVCAISGYGPDGPRSYDKAYDLAIQAEAGAFSVTGDEVMSKVGFSVADISAGMYALTSILAALVRRDRTGEGASIHVSMLEALTEWLAAPLYASAYGAGQAPRTGRRHHAIAPYGTFQLSDGRTILIAVQSDGEWQSLASALLKNSSLGTDPRFLTNSDRLANVVELEVLISDQLASISAHEAMDRLSAGRIAVARVNDLAGVWQHEQLRARGHFHEVQTEHGPVELLDPPFDISGWVRPPSAIPGIGEHDPALLESVIARGRRPRG